MLKTYNSFLFKPKWKRNSHYNQMNLYLYYHSQHQTIKLQVSTQFLLIVYSSSFN